MTQYAVLIYEPSDPDWSELDTEEKRQTWRTTAPSARPC